MFRTKSRIDLLKKRSPTKLPNHEVSTLLPMSGKDSVVNSAQSLTKRASCYISELITCLISFDLTNFNSFNKFIVATGLDNHRLLQKKSIKLIVKFKI